jgi:polysaccharide deacetylase 2 family uncharacterized protein YibQ
MSSSIQRTICVCLALLCFVFLCGFDPIPVKKAPDTKHVAIVIDDLGNGLRGTDQIFSIDAPLTVAIMPFLKTSKEDAIRAHKAGFEILLHLPMEPLHGKKSWLGPGAITTDLSDQEIKSQLRKAIESIPFVVGVNNHMGSKATADPRVVKAVLEVLKEKNLFILDSKTGKNSIIPEMAKQLGVPYVERTVFLDNKNNKFHIKKQLQFLINEARNRGSAVGIGHVGIQGKNTAESIRYMLPKIKQAGLSIVPVSKLVRVEETERNRGPSVQETEK